MARLQVYDVWFVKPCDRRYVTVGDEGAEQRVIAQRGGSGNGRAVYYPQPKIASTQHLIEQQRVTSCPRDVVGVEDSVLENIHIVERKRSPEFCGFAAHVAGFEGQILRQLALNLQVPVLDVWINPLILVSLNRLLPVGEWNWLERLRSARRYGQTEVGETQVIIGCLFDKQVQAG